MLELHDEAIRCNPRKRQPQDAVVQTKKLARGGGEAIVARHLLERLVEASSEACSDPLRIARELHQTLHAPVTGGHRHQYQVAVELVNVVLDSAVLFDSMTHVGQTALLLLLRMEQPRFFPEEWSKVVAFLSRGERETWRQEFKALSLQSSAEGVAPFPTPSWLLDSSRHSVCPEASAAEEMDLSETQEKGAIPDPSQQSKGAEDAQSELVRFLSAVEEGRALENADLEQLKALLSGLPDCQNENEATPTLHINDDVLSQVLALVLDGNASSADVTLYFRFLLSTRATALKKSPSQSLTNVMKRAAAAHPRIFNEVVLKSVLKSTAVSAGQVELFRKVTCLGELSRFHPQLLQELAAIEKWNENHLLVMQTLIQSSKSLSPSMLETLSLQMRSRSEAFASSLHFAKVIHMIVKKFPKEALQQKENFLEALQSNKTFFSKSASSKFASLQVSLE